MKTRLLLTALMGSLFLAACVDPYEADPALNADQATLNENKALWQRSGLTNYQYTYRKSCFCPVEEDIVVIVVNGQVSAAFHTPSGTYLTTQQLVDVVSIEGLFDKVQGAINQQAFKLTVTYHPQFGYPQAIAIDYRQNLVDEEIGYTVWNLQ